jgi:phosphoglucomutase
MNYKEQYQEWLSNPYFDENTKAELKEIADLYITDFDTISL